MWSSLESLKQNLNKIALDVHDDDDDDELDIYGFGNGGDSSVSDRRNSHSSAHANSVSPSHIANGVDSPYTSEVGVFVYVCLLVLLLFNLISSYYCMND